MNEWMNESKQAHAWCMMHIQTMAVIDIHAVYPSFGYGFIGDERKAKGRIYYYPLTWQSCQPTTTQWKVSADIK